MRFLSYCGLFLLLTLISFPISADAFSRRSHHSEAAPQSAPLKTTQVTTNHTTTLDVSAQAVPEPSALSLMSIGVGLLVLGAMAKRLLRPDNSPTKG